MSSISNIKTIIVTGVTGEIGSAIGKLLAAQKHTLVFPVRDLTRGQAIADSIKKSTGNSNIHVESIDLASHHSIKQFATNYLNKYKTLDVLVNNAAIVPEHRIVTKDGLETQFAVNIFAYFLLMKYLQPALKKSNSEEFSRIVNVASNYAGQLDLNDLQYEKRHYDSNGAYMQSKQADRMLTIVAANKFKDDNIAAFSCHPGVVTSNVLSGLGMSSGFQSAEQGAATPVYLATNSSINFSLSGTYWHNQKQTRDSFAQQIKDAQTLWDYCENLDSKLSKAQNNSEL